ncbi:MAG: SRPBCC domain-containing protein [Thermoplasmata archaeon]
MTDLSPRPEVLRLAVRAGGLGVDETYAHWTLPMLVARWWAAESEIDLRPGGGYRMDGVPDAPAQLGVYRRVEPPSLLAFSWAREDDAVPPREVVVTILPGDPAGAEIQLEARRYGPSEAERSARAADARCWGAALGRLSSLASWDGS